MPRLALPRWIPQGAIEHRFDDVDAVVYTSISQKHGKPAALAYKGKSAKHSFHFVFPTIHRMTDYIQRWVDGLRKDKQHKEVAKVQKFAAQNSPHDFKVGDILYDSWGYEQTNIDWYQITEVKGRSITMREIKCTSEDTGWMTGRAMPVKGSFCGDPIKKVVQAYVSNGKAHHYINSRHGWISQWDGTPKRWSSYA